MHEYGKGIQKNVGRTLAESGIGLQIPSLFPEFIFSLKRGNHR